MSIIQEGLTRHQVAIMGQDFEVVSKDNPLIREGLSADFPYFDSFSANDSDRFQQEISQGNQIFSFVEHPAKLIVCEPGLTIASESFSHNNGSSALYRGEGEKENDVWLVNYLAPGEATSLHVHLRELTNPLLLDGAPPVRVPIIENYKILHGSKIKMHFQRGDSGIYVPKMFSVRAGVGHQMEAGPDGAIFAIQMKNAALYPKDLRHIPIPAVA